MSLTESILEGLGSWTPTFYEGSNLQDKALALAVPVKRAWTLVRKLPSWGQCNQQMCEVMQENQDKLGTSD